MRIGSEIRNFSHITRKSACGQDRSLRNAILPAYGRTHHRTEYQPGNAGGRSDIPPDAAADPAPAGDAPPADGECRPAAARNARCRRTHDGVRCRIHGEKRRGRTRAPIREISDSRRDASGSRHGTSAAPVQWNGEGRSLAHRTYPDRRRGMGGIRLCAAYVPCAPGGRPGGRTRRRRLRTDARSRPCRAFHRNHAHCGL